MVRKGLFWVLAAGALLLPQFTDCMSAMTLDQQSMKCCGSMPCTPANHHTCCETMVSGQVPNMLPATRASLSAPAVSAFEYARTLDIFRSVPEPPVSVEAPQHSPPELYTLNASFLI
ncbi:MAG: hypothetical protein ABSE45_16870 [Candidatus Acidiferrales bacterium]|jgi:hypothetical protein